MRWALTPGSVGWFPAETPHYAWMPVNAEGVTLHCSEKVCDLLPSFPCIRAASPFLLLLLKKISEQDAADNPQRLQRLLQVMVDEIRLADRALSQLIFPADTRAKQVAQKILTAAEGQLAQTVLAQQAGLSVRTLSRLFVQQTGLTFSQWRQKARMIMALEPLLGGKPVSQVAQLSGYENVSAFIAVFRRFMGMTPGQFQSMAGQAATLKSP